MTIKNLYPKARPQIIYNVINGRQELPAASTFSRASEGTYVDAGGIIRTAAVDEPRFNYDPETGEFLGLMLEEERTNGFTSNTNYDSNTWNIRRCDPEPSANTIAPDGSNTAWIYPIDATDRLQANSSWGVTGGQICVSFFAKNMPGSYSGTVKATVGFNPAPVRDIYDFNTETVNDAWNVEKYRNGWVRLWSTFKYTNNSTFVTRLDSKDLDDTGSLYPTGCNGIAFWGFQVQAGESNVASGDPTFYPGSLIITSGTSLTHEADNFSLTSSSNFDGGFSLLLDSGTTTKDFIYKVKAGGTTIAELDNANGTLDWVVNGTSAATNGEYPQVGAIQPGRVRTVSSFGAADGTTQLNYLYTYGLSFPTNAIVASGADEVEFGPGQTLKAVYLWGGQLSNTEAVSVIKGEYNIVPNEPIKADSYSFVYNTDPENTGETSITLPYIVPTVSMRVYWGDGNNQRYEQGVTPSHTYPYPGQYRIQIEADDGFDAVRLADVNNTIMRVDQWAPQHRVGAAGDGFTGEDMVNLLVSQQTFSGTVPSYKCTNLTKVNNAFKGIGKSSEGVVAGPSWNFIPTDLQSVTSVYGLVNDLNRYATGSTDKTNFPTLKTSSALTDATFAFTYAQISNFVNDRPFTDSSSVTSFKSTFQGTKIAQIILDTSAGIDLSAIFLGTKFVISPNIVTSNATYLTSAMSNCTDLTTQLAWDTSRCNDFSNAWKGCSALTSFPLIDTSSGTDFTSTWESCSGLTSFPSLDYSSATTIRQTWKGCGTMTTWGVPSTTDSFSQVSSFTATWQDCLLLQNMPLINTSGIPENGDLGMDSVWQNCAALTSFPLIDTSNCKTLQACWSGCSSLTSFPAIDTSSCKEFIYSWRNCPGLTSFPLLDFSAAEGLSNTWADCSNLTSFPQIDTSSATNVGATWRNCSALTAFPLLDFSSAEQCYRAWSNCTLLEDFPANSFDNTGTLEDYAFGQAWQNCALTADSIQNILVSLDANGASNIELGIDGGTNAGQSAWSTAANTAYTNLINKGWTISFNA